MSDLERIAMLCHEANRAVSRIADVVCNLDEGRSAILERTRNAADALAAILRECDRLEAEPVRRCPRCGATKLGGEVRICCM